MALPEGEARASPGADSGYSEASTSQSPEPRGPPPSSLLDPIGTIYSSKEEFIARSTAIATSLGFRLYIGGERQRARAKTVDIRRLELACYKFRHVGEDGKRTRIGGCHFALRAKEIQEDGETEEGSTKPIRWELAAGTFVHNHDLGPPIPQPKRRKGRLPICASQPPAKRQRSSQSPSAAHVDPKLQPAVDSLLDLAYPSPAETASPPPNDPPSGNSTPWIPSTLGSQISDSELISMLSDLANGGNGDCSLTFTPAAATPVEGAGAAPPTAPAPTTFEDPGSFEAALAALAGLPSSLPSLPSLPTAPPSATSVASTSRFTFPPIDTPESPPLISTPPMFAVGTSTPLAKLQEFLRNAHVDLEQYAEAFVQAGCTDLETLLSLSSAELRIFVESDLPRIFPRLLSQPFHVRLMASIMGEEKERRKEVERILALTSGLMGVGMGPAVKLEEEGKGEDGEPKVLEAVPEPACTETPVP
ncbi:hypothetical protein RQP46_006858 [Phenoliferia psychrophenolica]